MIPLSPTLACNALLLHREPQGDVMKSGNSPQSWLYLRVNSISDFTSILPDDSDIPSLDSDNSDLSETDYSKGVTYPSAGHRARKTKRLVDFEDSSAQHPLQQVDAHAAPADSGLTVTKRKLRSGSRSLVGLFNRPRYLSATLRRILERESATAHEDGAEPRDECEHECEDEEHSREMNLYDMRKIPHVKLPTRRFHRVNSDFLRILVAKREMYDNGKLNFVSCSQFRSPRDASKGKTEVVERFGISPGWAKSPRRRWRQLSDADFH